MSKDREEVLEAPSRREHGRGMGKDDDDRV
jgi:hypothetical protein